MTETDNIGNLQKKLLHKFENTELLQEALTHPSYSADKQTPIPHNQRLEFLGDAVLQIVITEMLFNEHPQHPEGVLSKARSVLTNEDALENLARKIDLGKYLRLGKGEEQSGGRDRKSNLADAMEAVLGALYLETELDKPRRFLNQYFRDLVKNPQILLQQENPKGALQELSQEKFKEAPDYHTVEVTGPEHEPEFVIEVSIGSRVLAREQGESRKQAEKNAAAKALQILTEETDTAVNR